MNVDLELKVGSTEICPVRFVLQSSRHQDCQAAVPLSLAHSGSIADANSTKRPPHQLVMGEPSLLSERDSGSGNDHATRTPVTLTRLPFIFFAAARCFSSGKAPLMQ